MPHIRLRSVDAKQVQALSQSLPKLLAQAMETTPDNFTFELIGTQYFQEGKAFASYPFVEVLWFARNKAVRELSAKIITDQVKALSGAQDIAVIFIPIEKHDYFENGKSFA